MTVAGAAPSVPRTVGRGLVAGLAALLASALALSGPAFATERLEPLEAVEVEHEAAGAAGVAPAPPEVSAAGAVLWDPTAEAVLVDVDAETARPMASTTKIMTTLLALEAGLADTDVVVSEEAEAAGALPGVARVGLAAGDVVPGESLLAGVMLESGNDAAVAVAGHAAGSESAFVERMNARADELGLEDTSFVDASGLSDDPAHAASPADLARLAELAMRDERFAALAGAERIDPDGLPPVDNRNELLGSFEGALGVKTGYTSVAGLCLVAAAERDGRELYAVVLDSDDHHDDAATLLEHGFEAWEHARLETAATFRTSTGVVGLEIAAPAVASVPVGADVEEHTELVASVAAGTPAGAPAGEAVLTVDGVEAARGSLTTTESVPTPRRDGPDGVGADVQDALRDLARAGLAATALDYPAPDRPAPAGLLAD